MFKSIINIGVTNGLSFLERSKVRLLNGIALFFLIIISGGFTYVAVFKELSLEQILQTFTTLLFNAAILFYNQRKKYNIASGIFIFILLFNVFTSLFVFDYDIYSKTFLILGCFGLLASIIEKPKNIYKVLFFILSLVLIYSFLSYFDFYSSYVYFLICYLLCRLIKTDIDYNI